MTQLLKEGVLISCLNPLVAVPRGLTDSGKIKYMPVKRDSYNIAEFYFDPEVWKDIPISDRPVLIPCGKCLGCRLDYSRMWACRCMLEMKSYDPDLCWFLTLTYSDDECPRCSFSDPASGDQLQAYTLRKRDFQLWMKNLRKEYSDSRIRFYAAGEYGSNTLRPHYHVIVYGLPFDDLKVYKRTDTGLLYTSDRLSGTWFRFDPVSKLHFPRGFVVAAKVTWDTCAYVARYTAKKYMTLGDDFFDEFNLEKPFVLMSRRPGLGKKYLDDHPDLFETSHLFLPHGDGTISCSIPRYYFQCLERSDPELAEELKARRKEIGSVYSRSLGDAHKRSYEDLLRDQEENLLKRARSLTREL